MEQQPINDYYDFILAYPLKQAQLINIDYESVLAYYSEQQPINIIERFKENRKDDHEALIYHHHHNFV